MISRVRGTEDLLDLKLHNFILCAMMQHLACYNFREIQTPVLEHTNLFLHSLGEATDVVTKEMYTFETSGGEKICLRPEATAPTTRAYLEAGITTSPWKVFSYGPMFRHERPQKGRWRQFSQVNIEVVNSNSIAEDVLLLKMLDRFFSEKLHLDNYVIKLNFLGSRDERAKFTRKLHEFLEGISTQICAACTTRKEKNVLRIFDCKNETCQQLYQKAPKLIDHLESESQAEWQRLCELLSMISVSFVHDPYLVRGLDYYNKTVFEFASSSAQLGSQNAFCGGGRYELASLLGGKTQVPSLGAAIGMGRLMLLAEEAADQLSLPQEPALHLILPMTQEQQPLALILAYELQARKLCTDILLEGSSMKSMMRKANKMGARYVLIIGEDEQQAGTVALKNMQTGESSTLKAGAVADYLTAG